MIEEELQLKIEELEKELTRLKRSNELPQWNASHIGDIPIDTSLKKHGWGFAFNEESNRFEFYPVTDNKFFDHNELSNFKEEEHRVIRDKDITKKGLWSSARITQFASRKVAELKKELLEKFGKDVKEVKDYSSKGLEDSKTRAKAISKKVDTVDTKLTKGYRDVAQRVQEIDSLYKKAIQEESSRLIKQIETKDKVGHSHKEFKQFEKKLEREDLHFLEEKNKGLEKTINDSVRTLALEVSKKSPNRHTHAQYYPKGELNQKFKYVYERIKDLKESVNTGKIRAELVRLIEDRTPYGHRHRTSDVRTAGGQSLEEALNNKVTFWGTYSSEPSVDSAEGDEYWNTGDSSLYKYIDGNWVQVGTGTVTEDALFLQDGTNLLLQDGTNLLLQ